MGYGDWERQRKYRKHREDVKNVLPTSQTPNRTHPKLGLDNLPPRKLASSVIKTTGISYRERKRREHNDKRLTSKIMQFMTQPKADQWYSCEWAPGVRIDKAGNSRLDCWLNETTPVGGALPGTGMAKMPINRLEEDRRTFMKKTHKENMKLLHEIESVEPAYSTTKMNKEWKHKQEHLVFYLRRQQRDEKLEEAKRELAAMTEAKKQAHLRRKKKEADLVKKAEMIRAKSAPSSQQIPLAPERTSTELWVGGPSAQRRNLAERLRSEFGYDAGSTQYEFERQNWQAGKTRFT